MTEDGHGETPLTPEEEQAVARMLAAAGGPVEMPGEVAARLEAVLADLEGERSSAPAAGVVELRARRRWPRVLLAAAAVVVGGYAVGTAALDGNLAGSAGGETAASDSTVAQEDSSAGRSRGDEAPDDADDGAGDAGSGEEPEALSSPQSAREDSASMLRTTVRLRSDRLEPDVRRALRVLETAGGATQSFDLTTQACPAPPLGPRQRSLPVRYDGAAAVLVAGAERRGTVEVTIWSCDGDELDSTVVRP